MLLISVAVVTVIMLGTTIATYEAFRGSRLTSWLIRLIDGSVITQFLFNFGVSSLIMVFTGDGTNAGLGNLTASLIFPVYCLIRNKVKPGYIGINGKPLPPLKGKG